MSDYDASGTYGGGLPQSPNTAYNLSPSGQVISPTNQTSASVSFQHPHQHYDPSNQYPTIIGQHSYNHQSPGPPNQHHLYNTHHMPPIQQTHYHGVDIDTATIVSIASSCIILISGCIAVVCLIMYMKKTDMLYRSRTCAKCGAHVMNVNVPSGPHDPTAPGSMNDTANVVISQHGTNNGTPISVRSERLLGDRGNVEHVAAKIINYQMQAAKSQQNLTQSNKDALDSIVIYRDFTLVNSAPSNHQTNQHQTKHHQPNEAAPNLSTSAAYPSNADGSTCPLDMTDNRTLIEALKNNETKTSFMEASADDDEAAPYATFNLAGFESDSKISDTYETFAAKFSEPPYMLLKKGIECPPQYADSISGQDGQEQALSMMHKHMTNNEPIYQSSSGALSQYQSIASCSSNQDELIRAYEFGKEHKQQLLKLHNEVLQQLVNDEHEQGHDQGDRGQQDNKQALQSIYNGQLILHNSDHESPTDPGIREFTKSPPKPNEKRQGIVFHHQPTVADMLNMSSQHHRQILHSDHFANTAKLSEELSSNETTTNSLSSLKASSGAGANGTGNGARRTSSDDSTPSLVGSEDLANDDDDLAADASSNASSSSSTATPDNDVPASMNQQTTQTTTNNSNFGAIPRDRARNPSWANYTTIKSNTVLTSTPSTSCTTQTKPGQQIRQSSERAFVSFGESAITTTNTTNTTTSTNYDIPPNHINKSNGQAQQARICMPAAQQQQQHLSGQTEQSVRYGQLDMHLDLVNELHKIANQNSDSDLMADILSDVAASGQSYESSLFAQQLSTYNNKTTTAGSNTNNTTSSAPQSTYFGNDYSKQQYNNNTNYNILFPHGTGANAAADLTNITKTNNNTTNNNKITSSPSTEIDC